MEGRPDAQSTSPGATRDAVCSDEKGTEPAAESGLDEKIGRKEVIREVKRQLWLAGPLMIVTALQYGLQVVTLMFVGHSSELALSGASMAISFVSVSGTSILVGTSMALETFCGQSFGAKQYHMLGIHLQRAMLVQFILCVLLSGIWANVGVILRSFGQDHSISKEAGVFARFLIPGMYGYGLLQCISRFLQTQSIIFPMMLTSAITFVVHVLFCWAMVFKSEFGFRGAALANSVSFWLNALLLASYVKLSSSCSKTWKGFSQEALHDIISYIRLAIPSALMVCLELWSFELVVLLSGFLANPKLETSVLSITFNTSALLYVITYGLGAAASTRISNELGAGHPRAARLAACVVIVIGVALGTVDGLVLIAIRNVWGYAYSNDREVIRYLANMMFILAASHFLDSLLCALTGIVRGCGLQKIGVYVNLGSYYLVGIPAAVVLAFVFHTRGKGLWLGISSATLVQVMAFLVLVMRTNWDMEATKAAERINRSAIPEETSPASHCNNEGKV